MGINILCFSADTIEYGMLEELAKRGFTVYIGLQEKSSLPSFVRHCQVVELPPCRSKLSWKLIHTLRRIIREKHIDIIYSGASAALSNALFATLGTRVKNVGYRGTQARIHRTDPTYYLAVLNPRVKHIVCETGDIRQYLTRFIPARKLSLNTKPFDIAWVEEALRSPQRVEEIPDDAFKLIYIANTQGRPYKGLDMLVEAVFLLDDEHIHLTFIGTYDPAIYQKVQRSGWCDRIHFLGPRPDAVHFLPGQDVFILPSTRDASPRTVREAMACGVPCIVSDIPGARDLIVNAETGLLVEPANPAALAKAIRYLQKDEEKRKAFGAASRKRIVESFSPENYTACFEDLFATLAQSQKNGNSGPV